MSTTSTIFNIILFFWVRGANFTFGQTTCKFGDEEEEEKLITVISVFFVFRKTGSKQLGDMYKQLSAYENQFPISLTGIYLFFQKCLINKTKLIFKLYNNHLTGQEKKKDIEQNSSRQICLQMS